MIRQTVPDMVLPERSGDIKKTRGSHSNCDEPLYCATTPFILPSRARECPVRHFISRKEKLPAADTKSHTGDFSAHSETLSFSD
jgi:hypothetical protein